LFETYIPGVIIDTEFWLREGINNSEVRVFRGDYITFRRDRCTGGCGEVIFVKFTSIAGNYGLMRTLG
jgi:hypothetical protein